MDVMMLSLADLSDQDLLARTMHLAADERQATALLIAHLAELDARRLYLAEGSSSLFTYCTQVLRLSEHAAYGRIEAAPGGGGGPDGGAVPAATCPRRDPQAAGGRMSPGLAGPPGRCSRRLAGSVNRPTPPAAGDRGPPRPP